jgi:hypothetical protein
MTTAIVDPHAGLKIFDGHGDEATVSQRWNRWKRHFEIFLQAKKITSHDSKKAYLLLYVGDDVLEYGKRYQRLLRIM